MSISKKSLIESLLKVDLEYSDKLHELHNDYPLAPDKPAVSSNMLSNYCRKYVDKYEMKVGEVRNLISNLSSKTNYVIHYRNLRLSFGIKLTKIHRVPKFKQFDWMKKYTDFNTEKRVNAANDFQKHFFKLMINSVYGKTMEKTYEKNQCEINK